MKIMQNRVLRLATFKKKHGSIPIIKRKEKNNKLPHACTLHEKAIELIEAEYAKRGYKTIINSRDKVRIPDLLLISPNGNIEWIEVEWEFDKKKSKNSKSYGTI